MALEACKLGCPPNVWLQGSLPPGLERGERGGGGEAGHGDNKQYRKDLNHDLKTKCYHLIPEQQNFTVRSAMI